MNQDIFADLGSYIETIGGRLTADAFGYPTNDGRYVEVRDGDACNGVPSTLKVYVNGRQISDPVHYLYYQAIYVPPGDCIIIEFSQSTSRTTDRLCESWAAKRWDYTNYEQLRSELNGN